MLSQDEDPLGWKTAKHLLICGGTEAERMAAAECALAGAPESAAVYRLPSGVSSDEDYLHAVVDLFPVESPMGTPADEMSLDQLSDVQLDWVDGSVDVVVVWPEVLLKRDDLIGVLGDYLTEKYIVEESWQSAHQFRLIATAPRFPDDLLASVKVFFGRPDREARSDQQVAEALMTVYSL